MGKVLNIVVGLMLISFLVFAMGFAAYYYSTDTTKNDYYQANSFKRYEAYKSLNYTDLNVSYSQTNETVSTFETIGMNIAKDVATAQQAVTTGGPLEKIAAAFGLIATLGLNILSLIVSVIIEGVNLIFGIGNNLSNMPIPFNYLGSLMYIAIPVFVIYVAFKLAAAAKGWDI